MVVVYGRLVRLPLDIHWSEDPCLVTHMVIVLHPPISSC